MNGIGTVAMELIETIAEEFGSDVQVTIAGIVCEVAQGDEHSIVARFTDQRDWVQVAFLQEGIAAVYDTTAEGQDDDA